MSVLSCDRYYCDNVMCDHHSYEFGYLCDDCFDELIKLGIKTDMEEFMESEKGEPKPDEREMAKDYFEDIFKNVRGGLI